MRLGPKENYGKVLLTSPWGSANPVHLAAQDQPFVFRHFSWHSSRFAVGVAMEPGMSNGPKLTWDQLAVPKLGVSFRDQLKDPSSPHLKSRGNHLKKMTDSDCHFADSSLETIACCPEKRTISLHPGGASCCTGQ
jgi:hypothetical protein